MFKNAIYITSVIIVALICVFSLFGGPDTLGIDPAYAAYTTTGLIAVAGLASTIGLLREKKTAE